MVTDKKQNYVDETIKEYKWVYEGPVMCFEKIIKDNYKANTVATTKAKAKANIEDQYKRWFGLKRNSNIKIDKEKITCAGEYHAYVNSKYCFKM